MTSSSEKENDPMGRQDKEPNLREMLGPSQFSAEGYLGTDTRPPEDIIREDSETLARLGIQKASLVAALRNAYAASEHALGNPVALAAGVVAVHHESRGRIPSPLREDGVFPKGEAVISDARTGASISVTPLSLHLIDKHGFFQGKGSPYRVDPDVACGMMGMI